MGGDKRDLEGRPKKTTADYFTHFPGTYNDKRFKMLFAKMRVLDNYSPGLTYGHFWMLVENIAESEALTIEMNNTVLSMIALDQSITSKFLEDLIDCGTDCGLFKKQVDLGINTFNTYKFTSPYLEELLQGLLYQREKALERQRRKRAKDKMVPYFPSVPAETTPVVNKPVQLRLPVEIELSETEKAIRIQIDSFQNWIKKNCPNVAKMKNQLTDADCKKIFKKYSPELVADILTGMNNSTSIKKHYYVKNTLDTWMKNNKNWKTGEKLVKPEEDNKFRPAK